MNVDGRVFRELYNTLLQIYDTLSSEEQRAFDIGEMFGIIKLSLGGEDPQDSVRYMRGGEKDEPDTV